jgi:hypothetical protein
MARLPGCSTQKHPKRNHRPHPWIPRHVARVALSDSLPGRSGLPDHRVGLHGLWQDGMLTCLYHSTFNADEDPNKVTSGLLIKTTRLRLPRPRQRHRRHRPPNQHPTAHPRRPRLGRSDRLPRRTMVPGPHRCRVQRRHSL